LYHENFVLIAANVHALAMAGQFITFCPNVCPVNEQKVEILIHSSIDNFQPGLQLNNEQKADEMHVCPAIANAMLAAYPF